WEREPNRADGVLEISVGSELERLPGRSERAGGGAQAWGAGPRLERGGRAGAGPRGGTCGSQVAQPAGLPRDRATAHARWPRWAARRAALTSRLLSGGGCGATMASDTTGSFVRRAAAEAEPGER
ncbi:hypothetical protein EI555_008483, partial [Monodon monoceros]